MPSFGHHVRSRVSGLGFRVLGDSDPTVWSSSRTLGPNPPTLRRLVTSSSRAAEPIQDCPESVGRECGAGVLYEFFELQRFPQKLSLSIYILRGGFGKKCLAHVAVEVRFGHVSGCELDWLIMG